MNTPSICETRGAEMVSPKSKKVAFRTARFLRPFAENVNQAAGIPHIPLLCEVFPHHLQKWSSKVLFKGWKVPQKDWGRWVQELAVKHKGTWERSGIYDAILSSTYEVRCNLDAVLGLAEFWCPETSTFLFPWGEATITLEDMMILGGYSVPGKPVRGSPTGNLVKLVEEMERQRRGFYRSKAKKASHGEWIKHYMGANDEFEHIAFLSLWLSRFVFPQLQDDIVGKYVFPIAAFLSIGTRMALAPAVLASLYRDLTFLKKEAMSFSESIAVAAPFQLLQLWTFERFPSLGSKAPNSRFNLQLVKSAVRLNENFLWRPYAANPKNWHHLSFHKETKQVLFDRSSYDKEFRSFAQCLQATELVGIDCKEKYQPQRVARQFGFEQDIPAGWITHRDSTVSLEHSNISPFIPARSIELGVSARYLRWWKDSMSERRNAIKGIVARKGSSMNYDKTSSSEKAMGRSENCWTAKQVPPKSARKGSSPAVHENSLQNHDHGHNDNRGKPMKPQSSYPKNATTQFKPSCHSSKDVFPSKTQSSNIIIRKRKLSPTESNLLKTAFRMGLKQNGSSVWGKDVSSRELKPASKDTSDDSLDFLLLSQRIKRSKISREQQKISQWKGEAVEGDSLVNTATVGTMASAGTYGFHKPDFEERLQRLEELLNRM